MSYILAIDQGTTSSRAILFDASMTVVGIDQAELTQYFPRNGWVEHDPIEIWSSVAATCRGVIEKTGIRAAEIAAIGITNQRETIVLWDKHTGRPVYNAIVWQDRRTASFMDELRDDGLEVTVSKKTGLLLDPYFSASKIRWVLENVEGVREKAEKGDILAGTIDSYLIWNLTGRKQHLTDATNASRTMLFDLRKNDWCPELAEVMEVPLRILPQVMDCAADYGTTRHDFFGCGIPIYGVAGDQQAALIGQACFQPGMVKATYGTGCFALLNTGDAPVFSKNKLLTTVAYRLEGKAHYALEGSIFMAGAVVQWLRDGLGVIMRAADAETLAKQADPSQHVIIVPAFTGLGAPYWSAHSRGAVFGLTRNSGKAEFAKAALESTGYQTQDLLLAMQADCDGAHGLGRLRVDGGMSSSDWTMQFLADITGVTVERPEMIETTALGVAWLAGMYAGIYPDMDGFSKQWQVEKSFSTMQGEAWREDRQEKWLKAVSATLSV